MCVSVDLACLERINNRKCPERWRQDFCAKVTPSGSGALLREVNGRSEVLKLVYFREINFVIENALISHFTPFFSAFEKLQTIVANLSKDLWF